MINVANLYCDGGVVGKNPSDFGGSWAFVATDENDEYLFHKSGFHQTVGQQTTNNHTELIATIKALEEMDENWSGVLLSDSEITLGRIFSGWKMKNVPHEYIVRLYKAKARLGNITGQHLDGHPTVKQLEVGKGKNGNPVSKWNYMADKLCGMEVAKVKGIDYEALLRSITKLCGVSF